MKFITNSYRETKWKQFMNLKHWNMTVAEYEKEFSHLSKYAPEPVLTEAFQCRQFEDYLNESIKKYIAVVTSLQPVNFYQLVQATMKVKKYEMISQEMNQKREFFKGGSSTSKRTREYQVESMPSTTTRESRQGLTRASGTGRGISTSRGEILEFPHCHKRHLGICRWLTGG